MTQRIARRDVPLLGLLTPALGIAVAILVWWGITVLPLASDGFLARFAPAPTAAAMFHLVSTGRLWPNLLASLRRVLVGLAISAVVGFPIGLLVGGAPSFARASGPVFQFIRMVSPLSWTPLAIILLGVGDAPVYALVAIAGIWPIVMNTAAGVHALDRRWLAVARALGANRWELALTVVWPGIRPHVLTGMRLSVGLAWIVLVPAEMLGVDSGLGYAILDARDRLAYGELMAVILVIGLCGFGLDTAARLLFSERRRQRRSVTPLPSETVTSVAAAGPISSARSR